MSATDAPVDTVRNFVAALELNNLDEASGYLTDTFTFSGWTPKPMDKKGFLSLMTGLKEGIPGLIFNLHNVAEHDTTVTAMMQMTGYQTDSFIIPALGTPPIPQTASAISMPVEEVTFTVQQDKIATMEVHRVPDGGIKGLLHQLGIDFTPVQ